MKKGLLIIGCILCLLFLTSCMSLNKTITYRTSEAKSFSEEYRVDIKNDISSLDIILNINIEDGNLKFSIINPNGVVVLDEEDVHSNPINETRRLDPIEGTWVVTLQGQNFIGEIKIEFRGK